MNSFDDGASVINCDLKRVATEFRQLAAITLVDRSQNKFAISRNFVPKLRP